MKSLAALLIFAGTASMAAAQPCLTVDNGQPRFLPPVKGEIVSGFGMRSDPILKKKLMHTGLDYKAAAGEPVRAAAAGVVLAARKMPGYGNYVTLRHGNGYESTYAHLSAIKVRNADCVQAGDIIGSSGVSRRGALLHFEIRINQRFVDPRNYVVANSQKP